MPKCEICNDDYSSEDGDHSPRNLKCSHTLCEGCIKKMLGNSKIVCPFCREPTDMPGNKMESLHKNFALIQAIQLFAKTTKITEVEEPMLEKCKHHPDYLVETVCVEEDCSESGKYMCRKCVSTLSHLHHTKKSLIAEMEKSRELLQGRINRLNKTIGEIDQDVRKLRMSQIAFREGGNNYQQKANEITTFYSRIREMVNEREKEALVKLKEVAKSILDENDSALPPLLRSHQKLTEYVRKATEAKKRNNAIACITAAEDLLNKTKDCCDEEYYTIESQDINVCIKPIDIPVATITRK